MKILILPNDLPDDIASRQTPSFKKLAEHYTNLFTENQWISVKDRLPTPETDVLCWRGFDLPPIVAGIFHGDWAEESHASAPRGKITHWKPIKPPVL